MTSGCWSEKRLAQLQWRSLGIDFGQIPTLIAVLQFRASRLRFVYSKSVRTDFSRAKMAERTLGGELQWPSYKLRLPRVDDLRIVRNEDKAG